MKGLKVSAVVAVIAGVGAISGVAHAAQPNELRSQLYSYSGGPSPGPLIAFDVLKIKGGRAVAVNANMTCKSGPAPPAGIPANHPIVLRILQSMTIVGHRRLGYSGPATIYPIGSYAATAPTELVLKARFVGVARTRTATYPTGFKGSFASSACASSSPITFSFPHL